MIQQNPTIGDYFNGFASEPYDVPSEYIEDANNTVDLTAYAEEHPNEVGVFFID